MATQRAERRQYEDAIKIGQANAALIPRLKPWCRHLEVRLMSAGLLAEQTGLPIGSMRVICPHARGYTENMDLRQVAAYFVTTNCRGCPHHEEVNTDNAGREMLRHADQIVAERTAAPARPEPPARRRLRGLVSGDLGQALRSAPTTEQSILELVALLEDETRADEAVSILAQAAKLAPTFFSSPAVEAIAEYLPEDTLGGRCASILRTLGGHNGSVPPVAVNAALQCIEFRSCHDDILALLGDHFAAGGELPDRFVVSKMVGHQHYGAEPPFLGRGVEPDYPGLLHALTEIGKRNATLLATALARRLENPEKYHRTGTSITLRRLLPSLPQLGPLCADALLSSLDLDDDRHGRSADAEACRTLASMFIADPAGTQAKLEAAFGRASAEVKETIFRVYRFVAHDASTNRYTRAQASPAAVACLTHLLDFLLPVLTAADKPLEVRKSAAEVIRTVARDHPSIILPRIDAIFGALAILSQEEADFAAKHPGGDPDLPGLPRLESSHYYNLSHTLTEVLEKAAEHAPQPTFDTLVGVLASLDSKERPHELLKARLVRLFEKLAEDHATGLRLVPELFKALMDMQSLVVRAVAIKVTGEILCHRPQLVPDNMLDILILYLGDGSVMIHQAAAKAMSYFDPVSQAQASRIGLLLLNQFLVYEEQRLVPSHRRDLLRPIIHVCGCYAELLVRLALPVFVKLNDDQEEMYVRAALEEFSGVLTAAPQCGPIYVGKLLDYMARFPEDEYENSPYSTRQRFFVSLFERPAADIRANLEKLRSAIRGVARRQPYPAIQLLSVLLHHELYEDAAAAAADVLAAIPPGTRYDALCHQAELTRATALAETQADAGDVAAAIAGLRAAAPLLSTYVSHTNRDEPDAVTSALFMAHEVAERLG